MKRTSLLLTAGLLLVVATNRFLAGTGEYEMKNAAFAVERPSIDLAIPAKLETATFALG